MTRQQIQATDRTELSKGTRKSGRDRRVSPAANHGGGTLWDVSEKTNLGSYALLLPLFLHQEHGGEAALLPA